MAKDFNYNNLYELFINKYYFHKLDLIIFEFNPDEYTDTTKYINNMILILLIICRVGPLFSGLLGKPEFFS